MINCITKNISFQGDLKFVDLSIWEIGYKDLELADLFENIVIEQV